MYEKQNPLVALPVSNHAIPLPQETTSSKTASSDFIQTSEGGRNLSDEYLLEAFKTGNHDALSVLFKRYHGMVFRVCLKILRDRSEAEDVLQDVFLGMFRVAEKFDAAKGSAKAWILQYAYHRSLDRKRYLDLRKRYTQPQIYELDALESYCSPNSSNGLTSEELASMVQQCLESLSPEQRDTLKLACFQGFSLVEIAGQMNRSLVSVQHYYYRGLKKLKDFLQNGSGA